MRFACTQKIFLLFYFLSRVMTNETHPSAHLVPCQKHRNTPSHVAIAGSAVQTTAIAQYSPDYLLHNLFACLVQFWWCIVWKCPIRIISGFSWLCLICQRLSKCEYITLKTDQHFCTYPGIKIVRVSTHLIVWIESYPEMCAPVLHISFQVATFAFDGMY